jgi:hypothetical protein
MAGRTRAALEIVFGRFVFGSQLAAAGRDAAITSATVQPARALQQQLAGATAAGQQRAPGTLAMSQWNRLSSLQHAEWPPLGAAGTVGMSAAAGAGWHVQPQVQPQMFALQQCRHLFGARAQPQNLQIHTHDNYKTPHTKQPQYL